MILSKCKHISEIVIFFDFLLIILVVSSAEEERSFYKSRPQVDPKGDDDDIDSNNNNNNKNNNSDGPGWNATNLEFDKIREKKKTIRKYSTYNDEMFTFGMFENFQLTREVLCEEIKLVAELRSLRRALQGKIAYLITTTTAAAAAAPSSSWRDERELRRLDEIRNRVEKLEEQFPTGYHDEEGAGDYEGALRGLVFLQDTYGFDLKALSRGRLVSKAYPKGPLNLPNDHKLVLEDFYRLSKMSFSFKWYDRAIDFLAAAFKLLVAKKSGEAEGEANDDAKLAATMEKMRNNLVILNNRNLFKWKKSVSGDFKLHPFEIGDTLRKKKTQPDYVTRGEVKTKDRISRNGREAHFRQSCNGLFTPSSVVNASGLVAVVVTQCQLLHHGDPYLKLGPFKVEISSQSPLVMVFHDFFSEAEMQFLVEHSRPNLSRRRYADPYNDAIDLGLRKTKKVTRIIHKSVQYWIKELEYDRYYDNLHELEQNDSYKIHFPQMFRLTQKIELATSLNATSKYAATDYQTTNYG